MNLVDTSGWLEYFFAGPNASYFSRPIEHTDDLIVPVVCLYDVFRKINLVADEARALQAVARMKQGRVCEVTEAIAFRAALVGTKYKLPMADSLIYALFAAFLLVFARKTLDSGRAVTDKALCDKHGASTSSLKRCVRC
jgi:predicted nucleic acid-binding protein